MERAVACGAVPADVDIVLAYEMLIGPCLPPAHPQVAPDDDMAERLVDLVHSGALPR